MTVTVPAPSPSWRPDAPVPAWNGPMQVLSLDGGGLKGLFSATLLSRLEQDLQTRLVDHFDLIVGTSTGGLIALALGAGKAPAEIVDFYEQHGRSIFPAGRRAAVRQLVRSKYTDTPLRKALTGVLEERTLAQSSKRLVVPSYSLDTNKVYVFKTPHHPRLRRDGPERMVDVALATTAAPTYLPAHRLLDQRLIDGGVWANNPALVGVAEAVSMLGAQLRQIRLLSLGTTEPIVASPDALDRGGLWQWKRHAPAVLLRAQGLGSLNATEHLIGRDGLVRIDSPVPDGLFELDRLRPDKIRAIAQDVSRSTSEKVEPFLAHRAGPYEPTGRVA